jgi:hypothetical protein
MSSTDEYRRHAAECSRMAEATISTEDKAQWLKMGETLDEVGSPG